MHAQRGLTLLEVLVALALFAMIGAAAHQLLLATGSTSQQLERSGSALQQGQRALWLLAQDAEQLLPQDIPDPAGRQPYLLLEDEGRRLSLTRGGRSNPLERPRSHLQRIQYRVDLHPHRDRSDSPWYEDEREFLLRLSWPGLDGPLIAADALVQVLLVEPEDFQVSIVGEHRTYRSWPPAAEGARDERPRALRIRVQDASGLEVERWLRVF